MGMPSQWLGHETFQFRADPHHQAGVVDAADVGRTQGKIVGGGAGRQQHRGLAYAVGDRRRDEAEGLDGGQHL